MFGGTGNDSLVGDLGADNLFGGAGNDSYFVGDPEDIVDETEGSGIDTVIVRGAEFSLLTTDAATSRTYELRQSGCRSSLAMT